MPSTRRRFIAGVTALTCGLAGCNESTTRGVEETVTPVEVPRTDREIIREVTAIETPSVPTPVVVGDAHLESAIAQVERLRDEILEVAGTQEVAEHYERRIGRGDTPEETVEFVDEQIERAREIGASPAALARLRDALHDAATAAGYLRAEAGDLTMVDVEDALEAEREAGRAIRNSLEYRVAAPVAEHLPTIHAGEERLQHLTGNGIHVSRGATDDAEAESEPRPTPEPEPEPEHVAQRYNRLERTRRRREDAEQYLAIATDEGAPSLRSALESELADVRAELEPIADEYRTDEGPTGDPSVVEDVRAIRRSVGERTARYLSRNPAEPPDGELVTVLIDGAQRLTSFRSIDAGVLRTEERLDGSRFPTEALLPEKRRAVENVEQAADQPALHRAFSNTATQVLQSADRFVREEAPSLEEIARMYAMYVAGAEWADRGVARAEAISSAIQAQQS